MSGSAGIAYSDNIMGRLDEVSINGSMGARLPGNLNISFAYVEGESLLMGINDVAVSSGSACTSATSRAILCTEGAGTGDDLAHSSIRFGLGRFTAKPKLITSRTGRGNGPAAARTFAPVEIAKEGVDLKNVNGQAKHTKAANGKGEPSASLGSERRNGAASPEKARPRSASPVERSGVLRLLVDRLHKATDQAPLRMTRELEFFREVKKCIIAIRFSIITQIRAMSVPWTRTAQKVETGLVDTQEYGDVMKLQGIQGQPATNIILKMQSTRRFPAADRRSHRLHSPPSG